MLVEIIDKFDQKLSRISTFKSDTAIFSPARDLIIFCCPALIAALVLFLVDDGVFKVIPKYASHFIPWPQYYAYFISFLDMPHVYATFYRTYGNSKVRNQWSKLILWGPLVSFSFFLLLGGKHEKGILLFLTYSVIFHGIRQQYGWLIYSIRREINLSQFDIYLERLVIYFITIPTVIWYHFERVGTGWLGVGGEVFPLSRSWVVELALGLQSVFMLIYIGRQAYRFYKERKINLTKVIVVGSTWIGWGFFLFSFNPPYCSLGPGLLHSIPYLYMIYYVSVQGSSIMRRYRAFAIVVYAGLVGVTYLTYQVTSHLDQIPRFAFIFTAFFATCSFCHYLFDGYIWKTRSSKNIEVLSIFRFS